MIRYFENFVENYYLKINDLVMVTGRIENWIPLIDLDNMGVNDIPVQKILTFLSNNKMVYKCRSFKVFVLNTTIALRMVFMMVSPFLGDRVKRKIVICGNSQSKELIDLFHPSQLLKKYGGNADEVSRYWPPYEASTEYGEDTSCFSSPDNNNNLNSSNSSQEDDIISDCSDKTSALSQLKSKIKKNAISEIAPVNYDDDTYYFKKQKSTYNPRFSQLISENCIDELIKDCNNQDEYQNYQNIKLRDEDEHETHKEKDGSCNSCCTIF